MCIKSPYSSLVRRHNLSLVGRQSGLTLFELIFFMVIISVGLAGILSVMNLTVRHSADPLQYKQALAIAESLLEEVQLQPFTYCKTDDLQAGTALEAIQGQQGCAEPPKAFGPEPGEGRPFNHVMSYGGATSGTQGLVMNGMEGLDGVLVAGLENYQASVTLTNEPLGGVAAEEVLRIDVRVNASGMEPVMLTGYRLRYAPNALP